MNRYIALAVTFSVVAAALSVGAVGGSYLTARDLRSELAAREARLALHWKEIVKLQQSQVALAAHQSLTQCRCEQPGEADPCPICGGSGELRDNETNAVIKCPDCGGTGVRMKFGAGGRILPTVRSLADEAHQATIESRAILKKVESLIDDVESGKLGFHIEGSIMKGKHDVTLRRTP